jgi:hypothetical protein
MQPYEDKDEEQAKKILSISETVMFFLAKEMSLEGYECVGVLAKCLSWMCTVSPSPQERFAEVHNLLDEYEEKYNIIGGNDLFRDSKDSSSMDNL